MATRRTLYIKPFIYRGSKGFLVYGGKGIYGAFGVNVFTDTREKAELVRTAYYRDMATKQTLQKILSGQLNDARQFYSDGLFN